MNAKVEALPRCCPTHTEWPVLADHLCRDFPTVSPHEVLRGLVEAKTVVGRFQLPEKDAIEVGELMVRYRLMLTTGQLVDGARTDPQTHCMHGGSS